MAKQGISNIKLGMFVLSGLFFLVLVLYMIGKNANMFGSTFLLKARFDNIQGLVAGNNVRYSGIEAGTIKRIEILNDTTIEITMLIKKELFHIIRKNAIAFVGTEGLVGNKVINIIPSGKPGTTVEEGDILTTKKAVDTDEILEKLSRTNKDIGTLVAELITAVQHINSSSTLWAILKDPSLPHDMKKSLANIHLATIKAVKTAEDVHALVADVKNGQGSLGAILTDTSFAANLNEATMKIIDVGVKADSLAIQLSHMLEGIQEDINNGDGAANALLKDSLWTVKLNASLENIQEGTESFNQNMEALKHNFLLRGYYKKQEKQKEKQYD